MVITCKCLNITIETIDSNILRLKKGPLDVDQQDEFFKKLELGYVLPNKIYTKHPFLIQAREVGVWLIYRCLNCLIVTYGTNKIEPEGPILINTSLSPVTDDELNVIKKGSNYSNVFDIVMKDFSADYKVDTSPFDHGIAELYKNSVIALQKYLAENIRNETQATEERIRVFADKQYYNLQEYKSQAHGEYEILASLLNQKNDRVRKNKLNKPPMEDEFEINLDIDKDHWETSAPVRLSSSIPIKLPKMKLKNTISKRREKNFSSIDDSELEFGNIPASLDSEGLFLLDGMEDTLEEDDHSEELSDTDDSGSKDEGIYIPRRKSTTIAKSLPVKIPMVRDPTYRRQWHGDKSKRKYKQEKLEHPEDIAASIKALANSVHGDLLFGDLPPPRIGSKI